MNSAVGGVDVCDRANGAAAVKMMMMMIRELMMLR